MVTRNSVSKIHFNTLVASLVVATGIFTLLHVLAQENARGNWSAQVIDNAQRFIFTYYPSGRVRTVRDTERGQLHTYYDENLGSLQDRGRLRSLEYANGDMNEYVQYWGTSEDIQVELRYLQGVLRWRITYDNQGNRTRVVGYYPSGRIERIRDSSGAYAEFYDESINGSTVGRRKLSLTADGRRTEFILYWGNTSQVRQLEYYEGNFHRSTLVYGQDGTRIRTTAYFPSGNIQRFEDHQNSTFVVYLDEKFTSENRGRPQRYKEGTKETIIADYWENTNIAKEKIWKENGMEVARRWYSSTGKPERSLVNDTLMTYYPSGNLENTFNQSTGITVYYSDENIEGRGYGRITGKANIQENTTTTVTLGDDTDRPIEEKHFSADQELIRTTYTDALTSNIININWKTLIASVREPKTGETEVLHYWNDVAYENKGRFHRLIYQNDDVSLWGVPTTLQESFTAPRGNRVEITITYPRGSLDMPNYTIDSLQEGVEHAEANFTALEKALSQARLNNVLNFSIPKGTYHFKVPAGRTSTSHVRMDSFDDFVFNGQGSTFIFHDRTNGLLLNRSNRAIIRNLKIDWGMPLAFPVTIERDTRPGYEGKFVIQFINENLYGIDRNAPPPITIVSGFDTKNKRFWDDEKQFHIAFTLDENPTSHARPIPTPENEPLRYELDMSHWSMGQRLAAENLLNKMVGVTAVATSRENWSAVIVRESADVELTNLTVYSAPLNGYSVNVDSKNVRLANSHVMRNPSKPEQMVSVLGGATQHFATQGYNIMENNIFLHMMDDGANFHGHYFKTVFVENNRTIYTEPNVSIDVGDRIGFYDPDTAEKLGESTITEALFAAECAEGACSKVVLQDPIPGVKEGTLTLNLSGFSENFIFRRNIIHNSRARGVVAATHNGLIEENVIDRVTHAGIQLTHDLLTFFEGPASENILITNNQLRNVVHGANERQRSDEKAGLVGAITINSHSNGNFGHGFITAQEHRNITITKNVINGAGGFAITAGGVADMTILGNTIRNIFQLSMPAHFSAIENAIYTLESQNVELKANNIE